MDIAFFRVREEYSAWMEYAYGCHWVLVDYPATFTPRAS